jgi:hypothetical protein
MKPCTRRDPEIGKKYQRVVCNVHNFDNQGNADVGALMKE